MDEKIVNNLYLLARLSLSHCLYWLEVIAVFKSMEKNWLAVLSIIGLL